MNGNKVETKEEMEGREGRESIPGLQKMVFIYKH